MRTPSRTTRSSAPSRSGARTHYLDQYGFQLEGPVRIPGMLRKDGPVKLFYMGAFENYREGTPNPLIVSYPEPEMRTGDFSKLANSAGQPITIYNPFTATRCRRQRPSAQPFPGNIIPHEPHQSDRAGGDASTCRCPTARRRPVRATPPTTFPSRLLRQGQVLQPDPEVRLELRQQAPRLLPPRLQRPHGRSRRSTASTTSPAPTASSPSSASTTLTWRTGSTHRHADR